MLKYWNYLKDWPSKLAIKIGNTFIGKEFSPYIIAEMSGNHNKNLDRALEIVRSAKLTGVNAIKLQTYKPSTLTIDVKSEDFYVSDPKSLWRGSYLYELYDKASTPWEWHEIIFKEAKKIGLDFFSSAFDETSVDFLEDLNVSAYKIASFENSHYPLIAKVASTKKPMIISTGMASLDEISETVAVARDNGCKDLILLKCTSNYPAGHESVNLATMLDMKNKFLCEVGYSDHTLGIGSAITAIALGATVIEKHYTLERENDGVDSAFSSNENEMKMLVAESKNAHRSIGSVIYGPTNEELGSLKFRRSIYAVQNISEGEVFSSKNIAIIRPGFGLHPRYFKKLIGKVSKKSFKRGDRIDETVL